MAAIGFRARHFLREPANFWLTDALKMNWAVPVISPEVSGRTLRVGFESHEARAIRRARSMTEAA
jgi:hypothetical protein